MFSSSAYKEADFLRVYDSNIYCNKGRQLLGKKKTVTEMAAPSAVLNHISSKTQKGPGGNASRFK